MSDREIEKELGRIENDYLDAPKSSNEKLVPSCVQHIIETLILPALNDEVGISAVIHAGSQYEYSALPGKSDYDLQFCVNVTGCNPEVCELKRNGWVGVEGGPEHLLDDNGDLASDEVRKKMRKSLDQKLSTYKGEFKDDSITVRRADGCGPAAILNCTWMRLSFSIDVVGVLDGRDLRKISANQILIAKPAGPPPPGCSGGDGKTFNTSSIWKRSNSRIEQQMMRNFNKESGGRKLTLLKIMKVVKQHVPQLAQFTSYFYKNLLFYLDEEYPESADWDSQNKLAQRYKDMIDKMYEVIRSENLPVFYDRETNHLQYHAAEKDLPNVANYLEGITRSGDYIKLLKRVTDIAKK